MSATKNEVIKLTSIPEEKLSGNVIIDCDIPPYYKLRFGKGKLTLNGKIGENAKIICGECDVTFNSDIGELVKIKTKGQVLFKLDVPTSVLDQLECKKGFRVYIDEIKVFRYSILTAKDELMPNNEIPDKFMQFRSSKKAKLLGYAKFTRKIFREDSHKTLRM